MNKLKLIASLILLIFLQSIASANTQKDRIDSLKQELSKTLTPETKAEIYINLGKEYLYIDPQLSIDFASLVEKIIPTSETALKAELLLIKGTANILIGNYKLARDSFLHKCIGIAQVEANKNMHAKGLNALASTYVYEGEGTKALNYYNQAIEILKNSEDELTMAKTLSNVAAIYNLEGRYEKALENYFQALEIVEKKNEKETISKIIMNIANVYKSLEDYDKAMKYFQQAIELENFSKEEITVGIAYFNIGEIYKSKVNYDSAEHYLKLSNKIFSNANEQYYQGASYHALGELNVKKRKLKEAITFFKKALSIFESKGIKEGIARSYRGLGSAYRELGETDKALRMLRISEKYAKELTANEMSIEIFDELSKTFEKKGNYKNALAYRLKYCNLKDSLYTHERAFIIAEMQTKYETKQKEHRILKQNITIEKNKANMQKQMFRQRALIGTILTVLILISIILYSNHKLRCASRQISNQNDEIKEKNSILEKQKGEILEQNQVLLEQREEIQVHTSELQSAFVEITEKKDLIEGKNKEITDSIRYARKIQNALVTDRKAIRSIIPESFVLWKPLHIVSGDFYMVKKVKEFIIIVVADCTGHGVPGAFMSMLGIAFINEIYQKKEVKHPHQALEELRNYVKTTLKQTGKEKEQKEGMDIAICAINSANLEMEYAGAYNPIYIIREGNLTEYPPTKCPIGIHYEELPFENNTIQLKENDMIYLFTDGYIDQFGGEKIRKFKNENFKKLLLDIYHEPAFTQRFLLQKNLYDWIGAENEQVDDILVMGVKVKNLKA